MNTLRILRWLARAAARSLLALLTMATIAIVALWVWSGTPASLDWGWQRFAQPRGLQAQGLSGSLRQGFHARRLQAHVGGITVDIQDVALAWDPLALLDRQIRITQLRTAHVDLRARDPPAGAGPPSAQVLARPWSWLPDVSIDHLAVARLTWEGTALPPAADLAARYSFDRTSAQHRLTLTHAVLGTGRFHGHARLVGTAPFNVEGSLRGEAHSRPPGTEQTQRLALQAHFRGTLEAVALNLDVRALAADTRSSLVPPSEAQLSARLTPRQAPFVSQAQGRLRHIDLAAIWPQGPTTRLHGAIDIRPDRQGGWRLGMDIGNAVPGPLDQRRLPFSQLQAQGSWREGIAQVQALRVRLGDGARAGSLEGSAQWSAARGASLDLRIDQLRPGALHSALSAGSGAEAGIALGGRLRARGDPGGTAFDLALDSITNARPAKAQTARAAIDAKALSLSFEAIAIAGRWQAGRLQMEGRASGHAQLRRQAVRFALQARAHRQGGERAPWRVRIERLNLALPDPQTPLQAWTLRLLAPVSLQAQVGQGIQAGAGQALLTPASRMGPSTVRLAWSPVRWEPSGLQFGGRITGLPLSWLTLTGRAPPRGNMVFDANWDLHLAHPLRLSARLERVQGDITLLAETADGLPVRLPAGVREASVAIESQGDTVHGVLRWTSERAGSVEGTFSTPLARGGPIGWRWPAQAPLAGRLQARLPRIAAWSALAPPGWRVRGSLAADIEVAGTRADPRVAGPLRADDLVLRSVVDGIALQAGRLRARLDNRRVLIDELRWETGSGSERSGDRAGTLQASGVAGWGPWGAGSHEGLFAQMTARFDRLRASERSDRQITVSGAISASTDPSHVTVEGALRVDRARITVPDQPVPRLDDDVSVRNLPPEAAGSWRPAAPTGRILRLAIDVDLGRDARVKGRGVDTGVTGQVRVTGHSFAQPRLVGMVQAVSGHYTAYGQRLDLQRGILRFTGAHDDPALDVLAVRADVDRRVGVQVTGRAKAPVFRLWSQEPASEAEKLSWLVLGRGAAAGGAETTLLEQAALSLLTRRAGLGKGGIAAAFGLDELSVRSAGAQGAAITLGKRLGRNLYAAYERSLSGAMGTLYVFLDLSARLTLRAEAGDRTGVDLIYALSFDNLVAPAPAARAPTHAPRAR